MLDRCINSGKKMIGIAPPFKIVFLTLCIRVGWYVNFEIAFKLF